MAQCPAHDDHDPSLSIRRIQGQSLIYCHAGCETRNVLAALNLSMRDLYDAPITDYAYTDPGGTVTRTVYRTYQGDKRKIWQGGNTKAGNLYRLPAVIEAIKNDTTIYIVEGEKDVHAVESLGAVATTNPEGAGKWSKIDPTPLHGGKIVVVADKDGPGRKHAREVAASLDGMVQSLQVVEAKIGKDVSDHIAAGHSLNELQPWSPSEPDGNELAPEADEPNPLLAGLRTGDWLDAQVFPPLNYVVPGLIPEGLTLLVGAPKIGKSWLSLAIALAAASGGAALGHIQVDPRPVLLLTLEDGDRRLQDRIRRLTPGAPIPPLLHYMTRIHQGLVVQTIEAWLETIQHPMPLVLLDTLGKIMPPAMNGETTYQRDYKVAGRLKDLRQQARNVINRASPRPQSCRGRLRRLRLRHQWTRRRRRHDHRHLQAMQRNAGTA
jgi:hypothetical protein